MTQEELKNEISIQLALATQTYKDYLEFGYPQLAELYCTLCHRLSNLVAKYNKNTSNFKMVVCLPHIQWISDKI